ncbi:MAG: HAD hydrolase-like protein [Lachnospiraceae bacterium]|nr:HAD hydrolase-like protein [Lachnospiraceae bacterium]
MKKYHYFLFDLDGTLTEPEEGITKSVQYALEHFGIHEEDRTNLRRFIGPPLADSFQDFYGFDREKAMRARAKYQERYNVKGLYENAVIPGIPELLAGLRERGAVIALATSKPEPMARKILDQYGLTVWFDEIVGSCPDGERAAKVEAIAEVFRRMGLGEEDKARALMIGDRRHDVWGAQAFGIDSLGAYVGYADPGELETAGATWIAASMEEMTQLLWEAAEA